MTTIHAQLVGSHALVSRQELEQLLLLARQSTAVELEWHADDWPAPGLSRLAERGGAFDFWQDSAENIYTLHDGEPV